MKVQRTHLDINRERFQYGPIDILIETQGDPIIMAFAHDRAWSSFVSVVPDLLNNKKALLRQAVNAHDICPFDCQAGSLMWQACQLFSDSFVTPMAAITGTVVQSLLPYYQHPNIRQATLNNNDNIAVYLNEDESCSLKISNDLLANVGGIGNQTNVACHISHDMPVRGVSSTNWHRKGFSLGIADSVTVLAKTAAQAEVAATLIANTVNVNHHRIERMPANQLSAGSSLGNLPVTCYVPCLPSELVQEALVKGCTYANKLIDEGLIHAAVLICQEQCLFSENSHTLKVLH